MNIDILTRYSPYDIIKIHKVFLSTLDISNFIISWAFRQLQQSYKTLKKDRTKHKITTKNNYFYLLLLMFRLVL